MSDPISDPGDELVQRITGVRFSAGYDMAQLDDFLAGLRASAS